MKISKLDWFFNKDKYLHVLRYGDSMERQSSDNPHMMFYVNYQDYILKALKLKWIYSVGQSEDELIYWVSKNDSIFFGRGLGIYFFLTEEGRKILKENEVL